MGFVPCYSRPLPKNIDWEERRYEIAKDLFAVMIGKGQFRSEQCAKWAVEYAEELIGELIKAKDHER